MHSSLTNPMQQEPRDDTFPEKALEALKQPAGILPSIAVAGNASTVPVVSINGFPTKHAGAMTVETGRTGALLADYTRLAPIHPYFVVSGENRIKIAATDTGAVAVTRWEYVQGTSNTELVRFPLTRGDQVHTFIFPGVMPAWRWTTDPVIHPEKLDKEGLIHATGRIQDRITQLSTNAVPDTSASIHAEWRTSTADFILASEMRGKTYRLIDQIVEAASRRTLPGNAPGTLVFQLRDDLASLPVETFAGERRARLVAPNDAPLFTFQSTLNDGPRGRSGHVVLAFDAWFRLSASGEWELDALYPRIAPGTWSQFEVGDGEYEDLFRLSNF